MVRTFAINMLLAAAVALGGGMPAAAANVSLAQAFESVTQFPEGRGLRGGFAAEGGRRGLRMVGQADCAGAAAQAAAQTGGQVLSVSSRRQGDRVVCVVTVLVPGRDGERPRKTTINVPQ